MNESRKILHITAPRADWAAIWNPAEPGSDDTGSYILYTDALSFRMIYSEHWLILINSDSNNELTVTADPRPDENSLLFSGFRRTDARLISITIVKNTQPISKNFTMDFR